MTYTAEQGQRRSIRTKLAGVAVLSLAAASPLVGATAFASPQTHTTKQATCHQPKHGYVDALSATVSGESAKVVAHPATFHCGGEDDGHYNVKGGKTVDLTLGTGTTITVFKQPEDPSKTKTITFSQVPHWLKKNASEPIYRIKGSDSNVSSMSEEFHP